MNLIIFSNLFIPVITGLFFLLYFVYFIIANPSKAVSYKLFVVFLISFSIFLFGRTLQLVLGPHPLPLIIVNIRVFILCAVISPVSILTANIFNKKKDKYKEQIIIYICIILGITYVLFNTLGTKASYEFYKFPNFTLYDNFTPSMFYPYYGREVTIVVQVITGALLVVFSFLSLVKSKIETSLKDFLKNKIVLINSGILIFALSFIIGSIIKQWWIYYAFSIPSALLVGGSVLIDIKEVHNYYEKLIPFIKEDIIYNVAFSEFSKIKLTEMLHCLGKKSNFDTFIIINLKGNNLNLSYNLKKMDENLNIIERYLNNIFSDENYILLPLTNNKIGIVLHLLKSPGNKQIYILGILEEIQMEIMKKMKCSVTIGIGRSYKKIEDLRISYYEALNAQEYAEQLDSRGIIHVENMNEFDQHTNKYPVKEKEKLLSLIKLGDVENSKQALKDFLQKFRIFIGEKPEILKSRLYELVGSLIDSAILGGGDENKLNELITKYFNDINFIKDLNVVENWLTKIVTEIVNIVINVYEKRSKLLIGNAKKYIEENYKMQLSYKDVAREVFISPSYFLNLFKQETGYTFVDYLTNIRINKAKELLLSTDLNITEIAFEIGFNDSNYFSSLFKKIVGFPAKDYRKKI